MIPSIRFGLGTDVLDMLVVEIWVLGAISFAWLFYNRFARQASDEGFEPRDLLATRLISALIAVAWPIVIPVLILIAQVEGDDDPGSPAL